VKIIRFKVALLEKYILDILGIEADLRKLSGYLGKLINAAVYLFDSDSVCA